LSEECSEISDSVEKKEDDVKVSARTRSRKLPQKEKVIEEEKVSESKKKKAKKQENKGEKKLPIKKGKQKEKAKEVEKGKEKEKPKEKEKEKERKGKDLKKGKGKKRGKEMGKEPKEEKEVEEEIQDFGKEIDAELDNTEPEAPAPKSAKRKRKRASSQVLPYPFGQTSKRRRKATPRKVSPTKESTPESSDGDSTTPTKSSSEPVALLPILHFTPAPNQPLVFNSPTRRFIPPQSPLSRSRSSTLRPGLVEKARGMMEKWYTDLKHEDDAAAECLEFVLSFSALIIFRISTKIGQYASSTEPLDEVGTLDFSTHFCAGATTGCLDPYGFQDCRV
jgi:hypothetical protein